MKFNIKYPFRWYIHHLSALKIQNKVSKFINFYCEYVKNSIDNSFFFSVSPQSDLLD